MIELKIIQDRIDNLTRELKDCDDDARYEKLWEERADLIHQVNNLQNENHKL